MAISSISTTQLNQYVPPFALKGELLNSQILVFDEACKAFVNLNPSVLAGMIASATTIVESVQIYTSMTIADTAGFVIPWPATTKDSLIVTVDGIKQLPTSFSIAVFGQVTTVTFNENVPAGSEVEIQGFQVLEPRRVIERVIVTTIATDTIVLPWVVNTDKNIIVFLDGVTQQQGSYSFTYATDNTTTVTFSEILPIGTTVDVFGLTGYDPASYKFASFISNGLSPATYSLMWTPESKAALFVTIDGVKQHQSAYEIVDNTLVFAANAPLNSLVEVTGFTAFSNTHSTLPLSVKGSNLSTFGTSVYSSTNDVSGVTQLNFRTLVAGTGINFIPTPSQITIESTLPGYTFSNKGTGETIMSLAASDVTFKSLLAGTGIVLSSDADAVTVSIDPALNIPTTYVSTVASVGSGQDLVKAAPNNGIEIRQLKAGTGIVVTTVGDNIVISDANGGNYSAVASNYTVKLDDTIVGVTDTSTQRVITLTSPALAGAGKTVTIKDETGNAQTNNISIVPPSGALLDGAGTSVLITSAYGSARFYCNGVNWFRI